VGDGTLILTGDNTYTGETTVSAGTLQIGNGGAIGSISTTSKVTLTDTSSLLDFNRTGSISFSSTISGAGSLSLSQASSQLNLSNLCNYTGMTTISAGTISINGTYGFIAGNIYVATGALLLLQRSTNFTYSGVISGPGNVTKSGAGKLTLNKISTCTGTFSHNKDTLILSNWAGSIRQLATATLVVKGNLAIGKSLTLSDGSIISMDLTTSPASKITVAGNLIASGTTALNVKASSISNQVLLTAASGVSAAPFVLNLPELPTATLSATNTELKLAVATGIKEVQATKENATLQIYPNPIVDNYELTITNYDFKIGDKVIITDLLGRTMGNYELRINNYGGATINVSALPKGVYFVRVGDKTTKLVKK
jgi:autotransporter-associated beta strand protein